jgi:hypothetical protein
VLHEAYHFRPFDNQYASGGRIPILFYVRVTGRSHPDAIMVAEAAFQRLMACSMQLTFIICQKGAARRGVFILGKPDLTAFESR